MDEKSSERKEKDRKTIRRRKISSLKRQISIKEKQLEVMIILFWCLVDIIKTYIENLSLFSFHMLTP